MIPFNCSCGQPLQAGAEFAGKQIACPHCGSQLVVPQPTSASIQRFPPPVPKNSVMAARESEFPASRAKESESKSANSRRLVWGLAGIIAVVVLLAIGGATWFLIANLSLGPDDTAIVDNDNRANREPVGKNQDELQTTDLIPADTVFFFSYRFGDVLNDPLVKRLDKNGARFVNQEEMHERFGINLSDIHFMTLSDKNFSIPAMMFANQPLTDPSFVFLIESRNPLPTTAILKGMFPNEPLPELNAFVRNDQKYYRVSLPKLNLGVQFINERTLAVASEPTMLAYLDAPRKATNDHPLYSGILKSRTDHFTVAARLTPKLRRQGRSALRASRRMRPYVKVVEPILEFDTLIVSARFEKRHFIATGSFHFPDEAKAVTASKSLAASLDVFKENTKLSLKSWQKFALARGRKTNEQAEFCKGMLTIYDEAKIKQTKDRVVIQVMIQSATLKKLVDNYQPIQPF